MAAAQLNALDCSSGIFAMPYRDWSADALLAHFQSRTSVRYFPVLDATQVAADQIAGVLCDRFDFNGEVHTLGPGFDWSNNPSSDIEWLILLHKFYYAVGLGRDYAETGDQRYADKWMELTSAWIDTVSIDFLSSDVTGRRVQNWIFAHYYFVSTRRTVGLSVGFYRTFLESIHAQVSHLCQNLTPARNHRTLELYAIFLAAVVFPELEDAPLWLKFSVDELRENILSDILDDGVHCELSTDYHHIVLRNYLGVKRLACLNGIALPAALDDRIEQALEFSLHVHNPLGWIPAISDGDTGDYLDLLRQGHELYDREDMLYVATRGQRGVAPTARCKGFATSGYYLQRSAWGQGEDGYADERYLFFDCAALGAGNHGHLDLLNIEVAAYGRVLIVDPGRYTYDESGPINWRVLFRGTSYHNTVLVDGRNQIRYEFFRQKFKVLGPEPDRELRAFASSGQFDYLHGRALSHEYPVLHDRKILFVQGRYWIVVDRLLAMDDSEHDYELLYHLAPAALQCLNEGESTASTVTTPGLIVARPEGDPARFTMRSGFVSASYGLKQAAPVLSYHRRGPSAVFHTVLYPYHDVVPHVTVRCLAVHEGHAVCNEADATALVVEVKDAGSGFSDRVCLVHDDKGRALQVDGIAIRSSVYYDRRDQRGTPCAQDSYGEYGRAY
jgi:hypothetical protein